MLVVGLAVDVHPPLAADDVAVLAELLEGGADFKAADACQQAQGRLEQPGESGYSG